MKRYISSTSNKLRSSFNKDSVHLLSETGWNLAYATLWNTTLLSDLEIECAKSFIYNYFSSSSDPYKTYISFSERVLLASEYVNSRSNRFIPVPSKWFNEKNDKGFAGTKSWHERLLSIRNSLPVYKIEIKALAEAVLEMKEEDSLSNYRYWKNYFIERNTARMLQLFMVIVANSKW
ncbi:MAG: hypothetical protein ACJ748_15695 [Flavisolibacter sp.]